jgi:hypothetical protein
MTPQKSVTYGPIQAAESKLLMRDMLREPTKFMDHFRQYSANVVLKSKSAGCVMGARLTPFRCSLLRVGFRGREQAICAFQRLIRAITVSHFLSSRSPRYTKVNIERARSGPEILNNTRVTVMVQFLASANPGANLVDLFPSLDLLPDFLAPWRASALRQQALNHRVYKGLLNGVKEKVAKGELAPDGAFAARLWQDKDKFQMDELDVAYLAGTM